MLSDDPIEELTRLTQGIPASNSSIVAGGGYVPVMQIKSVEDVLKRTHLPFRFMGIVLILVGALAAGRMDLLPSDLDRQKLAIVIAALLVVGLLWLLMPVGWRYGWQINLYHGRAIVVWFNTPHEAANYRALILRVAPQIPFVHREGVVKSWR